MARQTTCQPIGDVWTGVGWGTYAGGILAAVGTVAAGVATALALFNVAFFTLNPVTIGIAAGVLIASLLGLIATLTHIRNYFFDHRLGCIAEEECALGQVWIIEDNSDGDRSLNLILAPAADSTTEAEYRTMWQAEKLVFHDPGVATADSSWKHKPGALRLGVEPTGQGTFKLPYFHCEIEGTFFDDWTSALLVYMWALVGYATAILALAIAGTVSGPLGWILVGLIALLALLALALGLLPSQDDVFTTEAGPIGTATPGPNGPIVTDSGGSTIAVGDFIVILGRHVVDTGHSDEGCWNELHPVRAIAKVTGRDYGRVDNSPDGRAAVQAFCKALSDFRDPTGTIKQKLTCLEHPKIG
jgi:hypothetical protein